MQRLRNIISLLFFFFLVFQKTGAQVVLNELMVRPAGPTSTPPNGLIYNGSTEYIELYNTGCEPVNVAGYFIAMRQVFSSIFSGGTFRIPNVPAAIIPSKGHLVLGPATAGNSGDVDINMADPAYQSLICQYGTGSVPGNFVLANDDGWCALYDADGKPVDALYWTSNSANLNTFNGDYGGVICVPSGIMAVSLLNPQQINTQVPGLLKYVGDNFFNGGTPVSRNPDGGNWVRNLSPSINNSSARGNCNAACFVKGAAVTGFSYGGTQLCGNGSAAPTTVSGFTSGGTYSASTGIIINPQTGVIDLGVSTPGGPYIITYTVLPNGCTNSGTSTASINIQVPPKAGRDTAINICEDAPAVNLFSFLGGNADLTGTWQGPAILSGGYLGIYNPATMPAGDYIYTVPVSGCPSADATIRVTKIDCSCPVFTGNNTVVSTCLNEGIPEFTLPTDATSPYRVVFKFFENRQADPASIYSGGVILGAVTPNGINAVYNAGLPGNTGSLPNVAKKYYVYAHLDPLPFNPLCRPVREWEVDILSLPKVNAGSDKEIIQGEQALLNAEAENFNTVNWTPNVALSNSTDIVTKAFPMQTTTYTITAISQQGCKVSDDVLVKVYLPIDIPSVFSPNGDGIHDKWLIRNIEQFPQSRIEIFNRYGDLILERFAYSSANAWDGTLNGSPAPVGAYYYVLTLNNKRRPIAGVVSIIR
jgi:gliding motility-associated-like protein